ncbi:hypothetical protein B4110_2758 [Parageobacillus toebii]|uniref:Uncharacterized protein n=1 Tax=Parageobacillus toebii TaxID=153151 RepID=A0A150N8B5_9BACL|nr:hypothetical protein B4110_2758 [Parageobacillus toebii]
MYEEINTLGILYLQASEKISLFIGQASASTKTVGLNVQI